MVQVGLQASTLMMIAIFKLRDLGQNLRRGGCTRRDDHSSFTPLVFSCSGGMGPLATVVYKRISGLISEKSSKPYSMTLYWLRCKLSFSLLQSQ